MGGKGQANLPSNLLAPRGKFWGQWKAEEQSGDYRQISSLFLYDINALWAGYARS